MWWRFECGNGHIVHHWITQFGEPSDPRQPYPRVCHLCMARLTPEKPEDRYDRFLVFQANHADGVLRGLSPYMRWYISRCEQLRELVGRISYVPKV